MRTPQNDRIHVCLRQVFQGFAHGKIAIGAISCAFFRKGDKCATRKGRRMHSELSKILAIYSATNGGFRCKQCDAFGDGNLRRKFACGSYHVENRHVELLAQVVGKYGSRVARKHYRPYALRDKPTKHLRNSRKNFAVAFGTVWTIRAIRKINVVAMGVSRLQLAQNGKPAHTAVHYGYAVKKTSHRTNL